MTTFTVSRLSRPGDGPTYHVHLAGCGQAQARRYAETENLDAPSLPAIAADIYCGAEIDASILSDFKVHDCAAEALADGEPLAGLSKRELYLLGNACEDYESRLYALGNGGTASEVHAIRNRILKAEGYR